MQTHRPGGTHRETRAIPSPGSTQDCTQGTSPTQCYDRPSAAANISSGAAAVQQGHPTRLPGAVRVAPTQAPAMEVASKPTVLPCDFGSYSPTGLLLADCIR